MKFIDIHTHILPSVDDGSDSIQTSIIHIKKLVDVGVETIFLTPHCMYGRYNAGSVEIEKQFDLLKSTVKKEGIDVNLVRGAEVYIDEQFIPKIKTDKLHLGNSNYVLIESSLNGSADEIKEFVFSLQRSGYRPILAHPERYSILFNDHKLIEELMYRDVLMQINANSLVGLHGRKVKQVAWELVHKGYAHFIASDDHCRLEEDYLHKAYEKVVAHIDKHAADLLFYDNPKKVLENKNILTFYVTIIAKHHRKRRPLWDLLIGKHKHK